MAEQDLLQARSLDQAESEISATSSYTASLVQSAARSVLDPSTSMLSDDESSIVSNNGTSTTEQQQADAATAEERMLESLQRETLPALPSEQDRKRFIGCLAAVLASSYEYDLTEVDGEDTNNDNSAAYLEVYVREEEGFYSSTRSNMSYSVNDDRAPLPRADSKESMALSDDDMNLLNDSFDDTTVAEEQDEQREQEQQIAATVDLEGKAPNVQELVQELVEELKDREEELKDKEEELRKREADKQEEATRRFAKKLEIGKRDAIDHSLDESMDTPTRGIRRKTSTLSLAQSNNIFQTQRDAKMLKLALQRHRRRRYQVMSSILLNCAKYLHVETSQSKAFLPLLARLLKPPQEQAKDLGLFGIDKDDFLWPFLESLTPGSGFRCLSMLILEHLLQGEEGYDARVRRVYKKLAVLILLQDGEYHDREDCQDEMTEIEFATRKFEALEHGIASKILQLSGGGRRKHKSLKMGSNEGGLTRAQVMRGFKIGSAGLVAGTLFAVTGGLAAPGIAAGVAALAGTTAASAAAVVALTSTAAVTTIFGVGGAGLAAYKMHRRQRGLTEFEFQKETGKEEGAVEAELFTTICISGWVRDACDFQRPWGVQPSDPPILDRLELLERFYAVHKPVNIVRCEEILSHWKGQEGKLWSVLRQKYGRDPSHLFPIENGPRDLATLTVDQSELIASMFVELGYGSLEVPEEGETPFEKMRTGWRSRFNKSKTKGDTENSVRLDLSQHTTFPVGENLQKGDGSDEKKEMESKRNELPDHIKTVWDYEHSYGGELYTVRFESELLAELCNSVEDVAVEAVSNATQHILRTTVFATLLTAVAIPTALVKIANMIDGTWTLAIERCDEAGKELAKSLLFSQAGRRPVTLIGYSMGARAIYACLKELARYQEKWEEYQERQANEPTKKGKANSKKNNSKQPFCIENMREPASILEDVIVMGMPNHLSMRSWYLARQLVAGRLVNCYSKKDLVLTLMFRYKRMSGGLKPVCGTCAIDIPGVENFDVSDIVLAHSQYTLEAGEILRRVRHGQPIRAPHNTAVAIISKLKEDGKDKM